MTVCKILTCNVSIVWWFIVYVSQHKGKVTVCSLLYITKGCPEVLKLNTVVCIQSGDHISQFSSLPFN